MLPLRPWEMEQLTPDEEARLHAHHRGRGQETHSSLTEAVERGW
jgi:hypothetical protein